MKGKLEVKGLSAGYGKKRVIENVSFEAERGKLTVIVGPNGSGKSTLLKAISRIVKPESGTVTLDGESLYSLSPKERARKITYMAQGRDVPEMKVGALVLHGRFPYKSYPVHYGEEDYRIVDEELEKMDILHKKDELLSSLSGGERQKAYLAQCLAVGADVVLFDEPTAFLDISFQLKFLSDAKALAKEGKAVVMVLHDLREALEVADSLMVMKEGRVLMEDTPSAVFESGILESVFSVSVQKAEDHYYILKS